MFPPSKTVTTDLYTDKSFEVVALDGTTKTAKNAESCTIYSESAGFNALFAIDKYPHGLDSDADTFLCTDNGGNAYNKCYYMIVSNNGTKQSSINEEWKSSTVYDLQISK